MNPEFLGKLCRKYGIDQAHSAHVARLCEALFAPTQHLHGLTKTSRPLLHTAAMLHDIAAADAPARRAGSPGQNSGKAGHELRGRDRILKLSGLGLTSSQRRIVAEAVGLHARGSDVEGFLQRLSRERSGSPLAVAARIGAILRIADGLDRQRTGKTQIAAVLDDGQAVEVCLSGLPDMAEDAAWGFAKIDLWNRVALRPIRSVAICAGQRPSSVLVRPEDPAAESARRLLQHHLEQLISREHGLGYAEDIEYVHEMRVATRRLRAAMRTFAKAVKGGFQAERAELRALADAFGAARDCDVLLDFLGRYRQSAPEAHRPLLDRLIRSEKSRRRRHYRRLLATYRSEPCTAFLEGLYRKLRLPAGSRGGIVPDGSRGFRPLRSEAPRRLRNELARATAFGRRLERLSSEQRHQLRIQCKRLRYTVEFFAEIYPPELSRLIAAMVKMQDLLGEAHDAGVYAERVRQVQLRLRGRGDRATAQAVLAHLQQLQAELTAKAARVWTSFTSARRQKQVAEWIASPLGT